MDQRGRALRMYELSNLGADPGVSPKLHKEGKKRCVRAGNCNAF